MGRYTFGGICGPRVRGPGLTGSAGPGENRQWEVAGIAGTSTPSRATSDCRLDETGIGDSGFGIRRSGVACFHESRIPPPESRPFQQRPKAGGFRPQPRLVALTAGDARTAYFTSTVAPAASRSFWTLAASSFETPSLTAPPASVRSLASFRPRPVIARTTLMTSTFFSPADFRLTVNSVCSSARSEEHTSELQSLMRISYAVFCLTKKIPSL